MDYVIGPWAPTPGGIFCFFQKKLGENLIFRILDWPFVV